MRAIFIVGLALIVSACSGGKSPQTGLKLEIANLGLYATGGMVIFGTSGKNKFSRTLTSTATSQSLTLELPKGEWSIGAMAWDGAAPFQGDVSCALTSASLQEDEAAVKLSLQNLTCFDASFSTETGSLTTPKQALPVFAQFCEEDITGNSAVQCVYNASYDFSGVGPHPRKRGFVGSYRFEIASTETFDGSTTNYASETLQTNCFPADNNQLTVPQLNIPALVSDLGVPFRLVAYMAPACDSTKGTIRKDFNTPAEARYSVESTKKIAYGRIPIAEVCSTGGSNVGPAGGKGDANFPYVICNANQLKWLNQTLGQVPPAGNAERSANYILGADIDLLSRINRGNLNPINNLIHPCVGEGDTWTPLGIGYGAYPACTPTDYTSGVALNFDGNEFTLRNVRYSKEGNKSGFIARTAGAIYNVRMDRAGIRGGDKTGAIAGEADFIINSRVTNSDIEGVNYVGGALGWSTSVIATNSRNHVSGTRIEGEGRVGGVIGEAKDIAKASFSGDIHVNAMGAMYIGGVVGKSLATITEAASSGTLTTNGQIFGGIAGSASSIISARSDMFIKDLGMTTPRNIGGIAGSITSQLIDTYFHGYMKSFCNSVSCLIGGVSGSIPSTIFRNYSTQSISLGIVHLGGVETLNSIRTSTFHQTICAGGPLGSCAFQQATGDIPRLAFEQSPCEISLNNASLAGQKTGDPSRGSLANPYRICHQGQIADLDYPDTTNGLYISIEENINASTLSPIPTDVLDGHLDGKGHSIYSLMADVAAANSSNALLSDVVGSVKNLTLDGFMITGNTCGGCFKGTLAINNQGVIKNVDVRNMLLEMTEGDVNFGAGGLVTTNYPGATISNVSFDGEMRVIRNTGAITGHNSGTISHAKSRAYIDVQAGTGQGQVGGISSTNTGLIETSEFRGSIIDNVGGYMIGGITAWSASSGSLTDTHFHKEAVIKTSSGSSAVGGLSGMVVDSTTVIKTSLVEGFIENDDGLGDVLPIVGDFNTTPATLEDTFNLTPTFVLFRSTASFTTNYNAATKKCELDIGGATDDSAKVSGALHYSGNKTYYGDLTYIGTGNFQMDIPATSCADFTGAPDFYANIGPAQQYLDATDLKANGFNLRDISAAADKYVVFNIYAKWIESMTNPAVVIPTAPRWTFEDDPNEGFRLFKFD